MNQIFYHLMSILEKITAKSEDSSVTTLSSERPASSKAIARPISNYRGIEGKSASGSDNNKQSTKADLNKVNKKRKPSVASVRDFASSAKKSEDNNNKHLTQKTKYVHISSLRIYRSIFVLKYSNRPHFTCTMPNNRICPSYPLLEISTTSKKSLQFSVRQL